MVLVQQIQLQVQVLLTQAAEVAAHFQVQQVMDQAVQVAAEEVQVIQEVQLLVQQTQVVAAEVTAKMVAKPKLAASVTAWSRTPRAKKAVPACSVGTTRATTARVRARLSEVAVWSVIPPPTSASLWTVLP